MPNARKIVNLRLSDEEVAEWDRLAAEAGQNRTELLRQMLLDPSPRTAQVNCRFSDDELAMLDALAAKAGRNRSDYLRDLVRGAAAAEGRGKRPRLTPSHRCPQCGGLTISEGKGHRSCSLCDWKGKA